MEIHWAHFAELGPMQRSAAEHRITRLAQERDDLIDVRIVAQPTSHHRRGGQQVRLRCLVPGRQIVASSESTDLQLALEDVLDGLERQIHKHRARRREARAQEPELPS
jgi:ribosomal subunit interface protein